MQKKQIAWRQELPVEQPLATGSEAACFLRFIYALSDEMSMEPQLYTMKEHILWAYYEHSCFESEPFLEEYGTDLAWISQRYPISIYGNVNGFESGELSAQIQGNTLTMEKRDVSGQDFNLISDLCVKIVLHDEAHTGELRQILSRMRFRKTYLPIERTVLTEQLFQGEPQYSADTYYRYLALSNETEQAYLSSLTVALQKKLWLLFLEDGLSPMEFDDAFNALQNGEAPVFPWELSLRLAMSEAGVSVHYEGRDFRVTTEAGKRLNFTYNSNSAAEKLFLKLLFPSDPPTGTTKLKKQSI